MLFGRIMPVPTQCAGYVPGELKFVFDNKDAHTACNYGWLKTGKSSLISRLSHRLVAASHLHPLGDPVRLPCRLSRQPQHSRLRIGFVPNSCWTSLG
jgi:hypothetical protein